MAGTDVIEASPIERLVAFDDLEFFMAKVCNSIWIPASAIIEHEDFVVFIGGYCGK